MDNTENNAQEELRKMLVKLITPLMEFTFPGSAVVHDPVTRGFTITTDSINSEQMTLLTGPKSDFMEVTITADKGLVIINIMPGARFKKKTT